MMLAQEAVQLAHTAHRQEAHSERHREREEQMR